MKTIKLYKYPCGGGVITVTPKPHRGIHTEMVRLVADEGKVLTKDGTTFFKVIDVDSAEDWMEVEDPNAKTETEEENHEEI